MWCGKVIDHHLSLLIFKKITFEIIIVSLKVKKNSFFFPH